MALQQDYEAYSKHWPVWKSLASPPIQSVVILSPDSQQNSIIRKTLPECSITEKTIDSWNLDNPATFSCDLIIACNIFMHSKDPDSWFSRVFKACRFLWMQDLFVRRRGGIASDSPEYGEGGDCVRYGLNNVFANVPNVFDLIKFKNRLLGYTVYDAGSFQHLKTMIHFVACFKGDIT